MSDLEAIADALWIAKSWLLTGSLQPTQGGSYRIHGDVLAVENYWFGHPNAGKVSPWPIDGEQVVHTRRKFTVPLMPDEPVSASATPPGYVRLERLAVEVSAGGGAIVGDESEVVEMLDVAEWWAQQNLPRDVSKVKVVTARGDSMAPDIQHGDVLFVDTSRPVFDAPGLYVMNWQGRALVKRLVPEVTKRRLALVSNNPQYPPEHIDADEIDSLRIAGRVCAWWTLRKY